MNFTEESMAKINDAYDFFQMTNETGEPQDGRFVAVPSDDPGTRRGEVYIFQVIAPYMTHANAPVDEGTIDSVALDKYTKVGGKNPAAKVSKEHGKLISFLLTRARENVSA